MDIARRFMTGARHILMTDSYSTMHQAAPGTFLYFGYGSNMLEKRLLIMNKTSKFKAIGKLPAGSEVWGVVYSIDVSDMENLDRQEGVAEQVYRPITVNVQTPDSINLTCRSYQLVRPLTPREQPSEVYKNVILQGALEHNIPEDYIQFLRNIKSNGYSGTVDVKVDL